MTTSLVSENSLKLHLFSSTDTAQCYSPITKNRSIERHSHMDQLSDGIDVKRSLILLSVQSRVSSEIRSAYSGFYPVRS